MNFLFFPILKKVARSFYLTIRFLPTELQEPVALAYLLARASDTIADCEELSLEEEELLQLLPGLLEKLDSKDRSLFESEAIVTVWERILEGQLWDLEKNGTPFSPEELSYYLYLVAGSVGEFWTKLSVLHFENFSKESFSTMMKWGIAYGKGLQLTNILRDRAEDARRGRFYCTESQVVELHAEARSYLQQGRRYVKALRRGRLKYTSALPLLLAEQTVALIAKNPNAEKVKVSRWRVYLTLLRGLPFLIW